MTADSRSDTSHLYHRYLKCFPRRKRHLEYCPKMWPLPILFAQAFCHANMRRVVAVPCFKIQKWRRKVKGRERSNTRGRTNEQPEVLLSLLEAQTSLINFIFWRKKVIWHLKKFKWNAATNFCSDTHFCAVTETLQIRAHTKLWRFCAGRQEQNP